MGKFFKILFLLAFLGGITYITHRTIYHVNDKQFAVLIDFKDKTIKNYYNTGWHFIYLSAIPDKVILNKYFKSGNCKLDLQAYLGPLEYLKNNNYALKVQLEFKYLINVNNLKITSSLLNDNFITNEIDAIIIKIFPEIIKNYEKNDVFPENVVINWSKIQDELLKQIKINLDSKGIIISSITKIGLLQIPDRKIYMQGLKYFSELLELQKKHKLALQKVQYLISQREARNKAYYKHLEKISELIKKNPDLIKYIYIDKMASSIKMGSPINDSEFKIDFDYVKDPQNYNKYNKKDIDNFK